MADTASQLIQGPSQPENERKCFDLQVGCNWIEINRITWGQGDIRAPEGHILTEFRVQDAILLVLDTGKAHARWETAASGHTRWQRSLMIREIAL